MYLTNTGGFDYERLEHCGGHTLSKRDGRAYDNENLVSTMDYKTKETMNITKHGREATW